MGRKTMKSFTIVFLSVLLLGLAWAEESKELSDDTDVLNADYHVCTAAHLRVTIRRLTLLRNRCWHTTKVRRARCRRRCYWSCNKIINYYYRHGIKKGDEEQQDEE